MPKPSMRINVGVLMTLYFSFSRSFWPLIIEEMRLSRGKSARKRMTFFAAQARNNSVSSTSLSSFWHQGSQSLPLKYAMTILSCLRACASAGSKTVCHCCLLYTSDAADDLLCVDLGG